MKRITIADWSAGVLAVAVLVFGGLIVVKPAIDHWDDLYRGDPFGSGTTTQRIEKRRAGDSTVTRTTTRETSASFAEGTLGKSGLLLLRLSLVAITALLAAAALRRALLGGYGFERGKADAAALASTSRPSREHAPPSDERAGAAAPPVQNGSSTVEEPAGAGLASSLAKLVASRREALGLSQRELAKRAGISHTVISRIENGQHAPSAKTVERLAEALR